MPEPTGEDGYIIHKTIDEFAAVRFRLKFRVQQISVERGHLSARSRYLWRNFGGGLPFHD